MAGRSGRNSGIPLSKKRILGAGGDYTVLKNGHDISTGWLLAVAKRCVLLLDVRRKFFAGLFADFTLPSGQVSNYIDQFKRVDRF